MTVQGKPAAGAADPCDTVTPYPKRAQPMGGRLVLTSCAACLAEACTYPIDMVKTRMQLQAEILAGTQRPGAVALAASILQREGLRGLYAGLSPACVRHVFYSGTRITVYEQLRGWATQAAPGDHPSMGITLLIGATAGAVGQAVAVPADLIKVRMQADGRLVASGKLAQPRYSGMADALRQILQREGTLGLWRGASPAIQRAALVNLGELATYDTAKQALLRSGLVPEGPVAAGCASLCSGLVAALVSTPADVIKTRLMNQDHASHHRYTGTLDCLVRSVRAEGVTSLWRGFIATWARLGPWQLVFWQSYESLRSAAGMEAF